MADLMADKMIIIKIYNIYLTRLQTPENASHFKKLLQKNKMAYTVNIQASSRIQETGLSVAFVTVDTKPDLEEKKIGLIAELEKKFDNGTSVAILVGTEPSNIDLINYLGKSTLNLSFYNHRGRFLHIKAGEEIPQHIPFQKGTVVNMVNLLNAARQDNNNVFVPIFCRNAFIPETKHEFIQQMIAFKEVNTPYMIFTTEFADCVDQMLPYVLTLNMDSFDYASDQWNRKSYGSSFREYMRTAFYKDTETAEQDLKFMLLDKKQITTSLCGVRKKKKPEYIWINLNNKDAHVLALKIFQVTAENDTEGTLAPFSAKELRLGGEHNNKLELCLEKKNQKLKFLVWESTDKSIFEDYLCKDLSGTTVNTINLHHCGSVGGIFKSDFWSVKNTTCVDLNYEYEMVAKETTAQIVLLESDIVALQNLYKSITDEEYNLSIVKKVDLLNLWKGRLSYNLVYDDFGILQEALVYMESLLFKVHPQQILEKSRLHRQASCHPSVLHLGFSNNGSVV